MRKKATKRRSDEATKGVRKGTLGPVIVALALTANANAQRSVVDSKHNLSVSGPGAIRAASEQEVCVFCHTPHSASAERPLWNREMPLQPYTVYTSSSLAAHPQQPTGASKMCLSCHDGSIALGSVLSRDQVIRMAGGITTLPPGTANLGTDLSDDHPISFRYDSAISLRDPRIRDPHSLPAALRLDANGELQCSTCHDAHNDAHGSFLVMDNTDSALCRTCHRVADTNVPAHLDCRGCHQPHTAPSGPYLLVQETVSSTCLSCHDGSAHGAANIRSDLSKASVHDTDSPVDTPKTVPDHVSCADCHEPHTMMSGGAAPAPAAPLNFGRARGASASGSSLSTASQEFEVCFRCHSDANVQISTWIARQIVQTNTRLEFQLSAVSFHPVLGQGRNPDVPSLQGPMTESSVILCSDCHGSDTSRKAGGSGPDGVHGSNEPPLLLARYERRDFTPESSAAYALCYRCHVRQGSNGILQDASFPHNVHVVDQRTPCSACHDAHGISSAQGNRVNNSHLINFDTSIVFPDPVTGRLEYVSTGTFSGSCTLTCHGVPHSPKSY